MKEVYSVNFQTRFSRKSKVLMKKKILFLTLFHSFFQNHLPLDCTGTTTYGTPCRSTRVFNFVQRSHDSKTTGKEKSNEKREREFELRQFQHLDRQRCRRSRNDRNTKGNTSTLSRNLQRRVSNSQ